MSIFIFKYNTKTSSPSSQHWLEVLKIVLEGCFCLYKRGERETIFQISELYPIFLHSVEKELELLYPPKACLSYKDFPIDFKVGATGVHINIEMDEKQIQVLNEHSKLKGS